MTLADKIWAAIQRPSPPVSREEIAALVEGVSPDLLRGSVITREDLDDNIVRGVPPDWALDPIWNCYRPVRNLIKR